MSEPLAVAVGHQLLEPNLIKAMGRRADFKASYSAEYADICAGMDLRENESEWSWVCRTAEDLDAALAVLHGIQRTYPKLRVVRTGKLAYYGATLVSDQ